MSAQDALDKLAPDDAWDAYYGHGGNPWNAGKVGHLYRRTIFGGGWRQVVAGVKVEPQTLVQQVVTGTLPHSVEGKSQPSLAEAAQALEQFDADVLPLEDGAVRSNDPQQLQAVWLYRMIHSPHPFRERMTLFWHDHFATSNAKIADLELMRQQQAIFREHSLGHFDELLAATVADPAMLIWLDADSNRAGQPNENLAREVLELFSLGVGNYTEKDIQEAARALTGWRVRNRQPQFIRRWHDDGEKTILGQTGPWTAADVVRIALQQPACSRFLVKKLFREFVSESAMLPEALLDPLASEFRLRNYDITWLMTKMLSSWAFFSEAAIGQRIKSPVEFVIGAVRELEGQAGTMRLADICNSLGESLLFPPSVKGWDGGADWLDSTKLLLRQNLLRELTAGNGLGARTDPARLVSRYNHDQEDAIVRFFLNLCLQVDDHPARAEMTAALVKERQRMKGPFQTAHSQAGHLARSAAHLVMTLPEYQLS